MRGRLQILSIKTSSFPSAPAILFCIEFSPIFCFAKLFTVPYVLRHSFCVDSLYSLPSWYHIQNKTSFCWPNTNFVRSFCAYSHFSPESPSSSHHHSRANQSAVYTKSTLPNQSRNSTCAHHTLSPSGPCGPSQLSWHKHHHKASHPHATPTDASAHSNAEPNVPKHPHIAADFLARWLNLLSWPRWPKPPPHLLLRMPPSPRPKPPLPWQSK